MKIDTEHLHFWMEAIRQSADPIRTMDAFWQGQIKSKEWLIDQLLPYVSKPKSIDIYGGWVGFQKLGRLLVKYDTTCLPKKWKYLMGRHGYHIPLD